MRINGPRWAVGRACNRHRYPGVLNTVARQISDEPGPWADGRISCAAGESVSSLRQYRRAARV